MEISRAYGIGRQAAARDGETIQLSFISCIQRGWHKPLQLPSGMACETCELKTELIRKIQSQPIRPGMRSTGSVWLAYDRAIKR